MKLVRPERFELPTSWFVARRSIQLSYGRKGREYYHIKCRSPFPQFSADSQPRLANNGAKTSTCRNSRARLHRTCRVKLGGSCREKRAHERTAIVVLMCWRRGRDSNPRRAFDPYALSRGAPSTTRPPLRISLMRPFAERRMILAQSSLGKAGDLSGCFRRHRSFWRVPHPHCHHGLALA